jgi:5-bromo-4-chloroindolyl phosphate hydrolysis protein
VLEFINNNYGNLNIRKKILNFDIQGAKNKFDELKDLKKLTEKYQDLKESLPNDDKPLEQYLKDDRNKLNELLKAVDKN